MSPPRAAKFASGSDTRLRSWDGACVECYFSLQQFEWVKFFPWCVTFKQAQNFLGRVDSNERHSFCGTSDSNERAEVTIIWTFVFWYDLALFALVQNRTIIMTFPTKTTPFNAAPTVTNTNAAKESGMSPWCNIKGKKRHRHPVRFHRQAGR